MNVLFVHSNWYPSGGDWTYISSVIDIYSKNNINVIPFSMYDDQNYETPYNKYFIEKINYKELNHNKNLLNIIRVLRKSIYNKESKTLLIKLLKNVKIDIVQLNSIHNNHTPSIIEVFKKFKIPIVWRILDYKLICPNRTFLSNGKLCESCINSKYFNCFLKKCKKNSYAASFIASVESYFYSYYNLYKHIDCILFQSNFSKSLFDKHKFKYRNQLTLFNPYNIDSIQPNYEDDGYILYFGRISEEKGIMTLIKSISTLKNINLKIVGDGPQLSEIKNIVKSKNLDHINFLGPIWGDELNNIISKAKFVIVPSKWYEPSPYSVIQALSFGKPVIGSNIGGISDLIIHNNNGLLFENENSEDLKEKILSLYSDKNSIKKLGINAREFVRKNCDPEKYFNITHKLFLKLISEK